ncbi:MAG TPA: hypothetical protein DCQ06_07215 [Myxococcales bacterium]|nr:hypothetical protein [Myxococcales bacterium]HAN31370.1 hypothetical protein [Myxococcales bacterium]
MSRSPVSRRYAQAMVELADEGNTHAEMRADFDKLAAVLKEVPEAVELLSNPTIAQSKRRELLQDLIGKLQLGSAIGNLAKLLLDKGRFNVVDDIHATFSELLDARSGKVTAEVTSAKTLTDESVKQIQAALASRLGKQVVVETQVDESLIGGLVIKVGNVIYDASVSNHLTRLRDKLLASHVG